MEILGTQNLQIETKKEKECNMPTSKEQLLF